MASLSWDETLGWRRALLRAGLPGGLLAGLVRLSLREPAARSAG